MVKYVSILLELNERDLFSNYELIFIYAPHFNMTLRITYPCLK